MSVPNSSLKKMTPQMEKRKNKREFERPNVYGSKPSHTNTLHHEYEKACNRDSKVIANTKLVKMGEFLE